jgi:plastocyanin domain-containing protein
MNSTSVSIVVAVALIGGAFYLTSSETQPNQDQAPQNNVSILDGIQVIEIDAKGGYSPRQTVAKADVPTVLKVKTQGTFDCSASLNIPNLNYHSVLESSGEVAIEVSPQKPGSTLQGVCGMGMYNFKIQFN